MDPMKQLFEMIKQKLAAETDYGKYAIATVHLKDSYLDQVHELYNLGVSGSIEPEKRAEYYRELAEYLTLAVEGLKSFAAATLVKWGGGSDV